MKPLQQDDRIASRWIVLVLLGVVAISALSVSWVFVRIPPNLAAREAAPDIDRDAPRVINGVDWSLFSEAAPGIELREKQQQRLRSYGWVDRDRGIVHIPIDDAIDIYLSRGGQSR